uniref:ADAMTS-like 3 n=1 Tax=Dicentrarchus labrax TaxID=13489 RepID=A0A8C4DFP0_DICLA
MESFILWKAVLIFLTFPSAQCSESQPQSAVFLPEFALSPQGSFMEEATEDQFLTYRYDDQASRMTRSDEDRDAGWDAWGPWSDCSRTCGGGASYSLRRCLNGGSCEGKNIRYRACSTMDCPAESGDFRAQQCSAHNDIKYQGVTYEWVPAPYDPSAPCALRCQAKGRGLTVELAPKVLDGTRCRADAFDMCISGVCQEVGCDRQLASVAREDNCGVCGGDGSTCRLVRGQALPHLTPEQLLEVPVGSRFLRLNAKGPATIVIETVSLQGKKEEISLGSTGSYVIGNTSFEFQRGTDRQTLRTRGPLNADYIIKMKYGGSKDTVVQFLFYQPIRYQWRETDFFPCSVTCGGGYQLNSAECTDIQSNQTLPEHHCNSYPENTKPTPKLKECNMDPCPESQWPSPGPWTQCSVSCGEGGGWQDRSVLCVEEDTHGQFSQVEEWKCTHSPRPITRQICNTFACPQWVAMEWSQCTVTCGRGLRYRVVLCIDHRGQHIGGCEASLKPHVKEDCLVPIACHKPRESLPVEAKVPWLKQAHELEEHKTATEDPTFVPGPWSPCSATCGAGRQTREVKCRVLLSFTKTEVDLPEGECGEDKPNLERPCNQGPCSKVPGISSGLEDHGAPYIQTEEVYSWDYRGFTACSATCAAGKQKAVVRCVDRKQGEEVEDSLCDSSSRPPVMIRICDPEPCPPRWEVTVWTGCSASCGVGIQTRSVFCMSLLSIDQQDILTVSEDECREFKPSILQPCNQVDCPPAWETEPWQQCSQSCGGGVQVRKVYCKQLLSTGAYRMLGDKSCWGAKPATNRSCSNTDCLPYMAGGEWGKCSVSCGVGIQWREPLCRQLTGVGQQVTLAKELCLGLPSPLLLRTCLPKHIIFNTSQMKLKLKCPLLMGEHHIYIQTRKEKRLRLTIGGHAYLLPNTSLVIKCPVRRFPREYIRWRKDGRLLLNSKRLVVSKSGSLKINSVGAEDIGVYKCVAGPASDIFTLQLIGRDSRPTGRPSTASPSPDSQWMMPSCHSHYPSSELFWSQIRVSLLPPGVHETSLQPLVEERLSNITLQADREEIKQEQASELISSLLTHMPSAQLWTRTTEGGGQVKGKYSPSCLCCKVCEKIRGGAGAVASSCHSLRRSRTKINGPVIIRQQQTPQLIFQKNINISVGQSALVTNTTQSLTVLCSANGFPPPIIFWNKDGVFLQQSFRVSWNRSGLHILQPRAFDQGQYQCTATNEHGYDSETSQILVAGVSFVLVSLLCTSFIIKIFNNTMLLSPYSLFFFLRPPGVPQPNVTWHRKNGPLDAGAVSLQSGSLWIRNVSLHNQGTYSCTATNAIGNSTASTVLQNINSRYIFYLLQKSNRWPHFTFGSAEFGWRFGDWTACSASCGNRGTWLRRIWCVSLDGKDVQPTMCQNIPKPITSPVPCNRQDCPPRWSVSEWSKCSASCGSGWKQRQVSCQQLDARGAKRTLTAAACERMSRPADTEQCTANNCPTWVTSPWGKCSGRCLGPATTVQKRSVTCQHTNGSSPASVRDCSSDLCDVEWRPGAWRACTVVCGSGFQSRRVDCVHRKSGRTLADQHCAWLQRPSTWQHCNTASCGSECKDTTQYCSVVKRLKLCYVDMYKHRCCGSCSQDADST